MSGHNSLHFGDPGYGPRCPECGGHKHPSARRCAGCYDAERAAGDFTSEAIITFRNVDTGAIRTRRCFGDTEEAQVRYGSHGLPEPGRWVVDCRSTPYSILTDLRGRRASPRPRRRGRRSRA